MGGELEDRVAVVSGGSRGLGRAISIALGAAGAHVVVNFASNVEPAEDTVRDIMTAGGSAISARGDVTSADGAADVVDMADRRFGAVDILVNNATGPQPTLLIGDGDWDSYLDQLRFTVAAPVHLGRAALPGMRERGAGSIVNIGSEVVERPTAGLAAYTTAKAAMIGLTRSWATELGALGIRVNLVSPGFVPVERHGDVAEADRRVYLEGVLLGRMGEPQDIANTVVFLASDRASFLTGQVITVNGGRTFGM